MKSIPDYFPDYLIICDIVHSMECVTLLFTPLRGSFLTSKYVLVLNHPNRADIPTKSLANNNKSYIITDLHHCIKHVDCMCCQATNRQSV